MATSSRRSFDFNYANDNAGQFIRVTDQAVPAFKHVTTTAYDLAGQRLREKLTQGSAV